MNQINFRDMKIYTPLTTEERKKYDEEKAKFIKFSKWINRRILILWNEHVKISCKYRNYDESFARNKLNFLREIARKKREEFYRNIGI